MLKSLWASVLSWKISRISSRCLAAVSPFTLNPYHGHPHVLDFVVI